MVYLNGKKVDALEIDPAKHKYIGSFRTPWETIQANMFKAAQEHGPISVVACPCGAHLWSAQAHHKHWLQGHCDIEQYIDIGADTNGGNKGT